MEIQKVRYRIIVNNSYEISLDDFVNWSGLSRNVIDMLAIQKVYQYMPNGYRVDFIEYEENI